MKKVITNYSRRTAGKVVVVAKNSSTKLNGNLLFPNLPVSLVDQNAQIAVVEAAITAAAGKDRGKLAILRVEKKTLAGMLRQNAEYVNTTVQNGDEAALLSSGFDLTKTPEKNQLPGAIEEIDAKFTNLPGVIDLGWKRARFAKSYNVFISSDMGQTWAMLDTVFGRKMLVKQLNSGVRYQFKVVPVGLHGEGQVSDIASQVAA